MTQRRLPLLLWAALWPGICASHVAAQAGRSADNPVLESRIARFEVIGRTIRESVMQLGSERLPLHLGFEAVLKEKTSDADSDPRFTLHLANKTVREILDALCAMDTRFTWSSDPFGVNIFPRATSGKASYFMNRRIGRLQLYDIRDAYQALTPLARHFPDEQVGYRHLGGNVAFPEPWTATFKDLTVRELMNRIAAHLGPSGGWMFYGSEDTRWFNFHKAPYSPLAVAAQGGAAQPSQEVVNQRVAAIMQGALQKGVVTTRDGIRVTPGRADVSLQDMDEVKSFGSRAIAALSVYLDGPDYRAQHLAVRMLSGIGGKGVIAPLTKAAERSPSAIVRLAALECLGQQPWKDIEGTVKHIFASDPDSLVHKQAKQMIDVHAAK